MRYSKNKFILFSFEKQVRKVYQLLLVLDSCLDDVNVEHLTRLVFFSPYFKQFERLNFFLENVNIENLQSAIVELEQYQMLSIKDHNMIIYKKDFSQVQSLFPTKVILHDIRSSFNVGSIFRTSECFGVESVLLSGYTQSPVNNKVKKTAMGVEEYQNWEQIDNLKCKLNFFKKNSCKIYGLETAEPSQNLFEVKFDFPNVIMLGNEALGLSTEELKMCDEIIRIPMYGKKNSLNVGVAFAVLIAEMRNYWEKMKNKEI